MITATRFRERWRAATLPADARLARFRPDMVHVFFSWTDQGIDHLWAAGKAGIPAVASIHNTFPRWPLTAWHRRHMPAAFRAVRGVYGVSRAALEGFGETYGPWLGERVRKTVIYNSVDTDRFQPSPSARLRTRKRLGIPGHVPVIGCVGRLADQKRPLDVLEVFRRVRRRLPEARLLFVGSGHLEDAVRSEIVRTGLGGAVIIEPFSDRVEDLYPAMDLHMLLSHNEGFGIVTAEAMACGVPVIGTRTPGTEEVIRGTKAGALVPVGDVGAIAHAAIDHSGKRSRRAGAIGAGRTRGCRSAFRSGCLVGQADALLCGGSG